MKKISKKASAPVKECGNPDCRQMVHVRVRRCECGYEFPVKNASQTAVTELSEILVELNESPDKQLLLASIAFFLKHLDFIRSSVKEAPVKLTDIANAAEEKQLDLLRAFNFQKRLKAHASIIGDEYVDKLVGLLESTLRKDER